MVSSQQGYWPEAPTTGALHVDTWAFSQHGGCVPRTGTQKEQDKSCITSYELPLEFTLLHFGQSREPHLRRRNIDSHFSMGKG